MQAADKHFAGSIPEIYDTLMVPLIFEPYVRTSPHGWSALRRAAC